MSVTFEKTIGHQGQAQERIRRLKLNSPRSLFWMCFLGGPLIGFLFLRPNAKQLTSYSRDLFVGVLTIVLLFFFISLPFVEIGEMFGMHDPHRFGSMRRIVPRALGLVLYFCHFKSNESEYRLYELQEQKYRSPWVDSVIYSVVGMVIIFGYLYFIKWPR